MARLICGWKAHVRLANFARSPANTAGSALMYWDMHKCGRSKILYNADGTWRKRIKIRHEMRGGRNMYPVGMV